jgi:AcrR family transcriptional regulator
MAGKRISAEARREVVLRSARRLFGTAGYEGTTLDDVAAAAGVTKPIVYRHFASKEALYLAVLDRHSDDFPIFFEGIEVAGNGTPDLMVGTILDRWLDYVRENRHSWLMLFRDAGGGEAIRARRGTVSLEAREVLAHVIALAGVVAADEVEPTAELLTSGLAGLALWWNDNPDVPKARLLDVAARMCAPALGPA